MSKRHQSRSSSKSTPGSPSVSEARSDEFLFVNRDQATIMDGTRSHQVSSHVQLSNRKRLFLEQEVLQTKNPVPRSPPSANPPRRGGEIQPWKVDRPPRHRKNAEDAGRLLATDRSFSPGPRSSSIQRGNSDPFSALPISVDPVTNRILSWYRDDGLPSMFPLEKAVLGVSMPSARRVWERTVNALEIPGLAESQVAWVCVLMGQRTQSDIIQNLGSELKAKACSIIRQRSSDAQGCHDPDTRRMILDMFWAEQSTDNQTAAQAHLALLADWARTQDPSKLDVDFRIELLTADVCVSGSKMTMPLFDASIWAREETLDEWRVDLEDQGEEVIASRFDPLDEAITDGRLRIAFSRLRGLAIVAELAVSREIRSPSVFQWLDLRLLSCESQLLRASLESSGHMFDEAGGTSTENRSSYQSCCASLTGLAWIWSTFVSTLRHGKPLLASRLQEAQRNAIHTESRNLTLWSFHVGRLLEKKIEEEVGDSTAKGWHSVQYELSSAGADDGDWDSISRILGRFVHSEILRQLDL